MEGVVPSIITVSPRMADTRSSTMIPFFLPRGAGAAPGQVRDMALMAPAVVAAAAVQAKDWVEPVRRVGTVGGLMTVPVTAVMPAQEAEALLKTEETSGIQVLPAVAEAGTEDVDWM